MTSKEIKKEMLFCLLYRMGYHAAFTEFDYADVFAITRSGYTHEFEIKVSKGDLMSELNCVKEFTLFGEIKKGYSKRFKHQHYLKGETDQFITVPSYFSFCIPPNLIKTAEEILKDTPYGIYKFKQGFDPCMSCVKKAAFLNKEKISEKLIFKLLRKASTEVQTLRSLTASNS